MSVNEFSIHNEKNSTTLLVLKSGEKTVELKLQSGFTEEREYFFLKESETEGPEEITNLFMSKYFQYRDTCCFETLRTCWFHINRLNPWSD